MIYLFISIVYLFIYSCLFHLFTGLLSYQYFQSFDDVAINLNFQFQGTVIATQSTKGKFIVGNTNRADY
jgi:hypothetical protein